MAAPPLRRGSYVDGPRLARIGLGSMLGSLALICLAYDWVCDHWPRWASRTVRSKHENGICCR
jgi:hypothetical protein